MSGGTFRDCYDIADTIQAAIDNNDRITDYGYVQGFGQETLDRFREAIAYQKIADAYAHRIDWLLAGDDGEATFHYRLTDDLKALADGRPDPKVKAILELAI
jgi:hypothetical protein